MVTCFSMYIAFETAKRDLALYSMHSSATMANEFMLTENELCSANTYDVCSEAWKPRYLHVWSRNL